MQCKNCLLSPILLLFTLAHATPPCAATQASVLKAVLSKLPPGAAVSSDQLRSLCGVWARDLCGQPFKLLSGSWELALQDAFAEQPPPPPPPPPPSRNGRRGSRRSSTSAPPAPGKFIVPATPLWVDPRPLPELSTHCLGELVEGSTTWLTNDAQRADELLVEFGFDTCAHIGLDLEWTPTMVRGQLAQVSMMQIATREHCLLLRVGQMVERAAALNRESNGASAAQNPPSLLMPVAAAGSASAASPLPPVLRTVLSSDAPLKVGRGIKEDAKLIRRQLGVIPAGVAELPGRLSLKELARTTTSLKQPVQKRWMANWDAQTLDEEVLYYAAFDAISAYEIYKRAPPPKQAKPRRSGAAWKKRRQEKAAGGAGAQESAARE